MASRPAGLTHRVGTASDRSVWERIASGLGRAPVAAWLLLLVLAPLALILAALVGRFAGRRAGKLAATVVAR